VTSLNRSYSMITCPTCGNLVPTSNWPEHLMADFRIIQIIKATHPEWNRQECEDYLRSLCSAKAGVRASPEEGHPSPPDGLWRNDDRIEDLDC
jgi:hypothetical protein